jgi:hypothetical protein
MAALRAPVHLVEVIEEAQFAAVHESAFGTNRTTALNDVRFRG